ncbi:hypothetical protein AB1Y20_021904 [Prymnesium parvum]|uniref:Mannosyltransferase n=1 Tax=Prymnesium parvum TaxID=97485 RepID=A0AB34JH73_PRYPA
MPTSIWFCGVKEVWPFFAAPLVPTQCYFSATINREEVEAHGVSVWEAKSDCSCIPAPPPPVSPPSRIYFCGLPAVWHFFENPLLPTTCYYSYSLTRIEVMSQGVDVYHDAAGCHCIPPPPPSPTIPPLPPPISPAVPPLPPSHPPAPPRSPAPCGPPPPAPSPTPSLPVDASPLRMSPLTSLTPPSGFRLLPSPMPLPQTPAASAEKTVPLLDLLRSEPQAVASASTDIGSSGLLHVSPLLMFVLLASGAVITYFRHVASVRPAETALEQEGEPLAAPAGVRLDLL